MRLIVAVLAILLAVGCAESPRPYLVTQYVPVIPNRTFVARPGEKEEMPADCNSIKDDMKREMCMAAKSYDVTMREADMVFTLASAERVANECGFAISDNCLTLKNRVWGEGKLKRMYLERARHFSLKEYYDKRTFCTDLYMQDKRTYNLFQ